MSDGTYASNARAFNEWLTNEWLSGYPYKNVAVFDFYNVLTTNGGNQNINDLGQVTGNHHRWWNNAVQHKVDGDNDGNPNVLEYPSGDDHPSIAGNLKATGEFQALLNIYVETTPVSTLYLSHIGSNKKLYYGKWNHDGSSVQHRSAPRRR